MQKNLASQPTFKEKPKIKRPSLTLLSPTYSTPKPQKNIKKSENPCPIYILWKDKHISLQEYSCIFKYLELRRYASKLIGTPSHKSSRYSNLHIQYSKTNKWLQTELAFQNRLVDSQNASKALSNLKLIEKSLLTLPGQIALYFRSLLNNTVKKNFAANKRLYAKAIRLSAQIIKQHL